MGSVIISPGSAHLAGGLGLQYPTQHDKHSPNNIECVLIKKGDIYCVPSARGLLRTLSFNLRTL